MPNKQQKLSSSIYPNKFQSSSSINLAKIIKFQFSDEQIHKQQQKKTRSQPTQHKQLKLTDISKNKLKDSSNKMKGKQMKRSSSKQNQAISKQSRSHAARWTCSRSRNHVVKQPGLGQQSRWTCNKSRSHATMQQQQYTESNSKTKNNSAQKFSFYCSLNQYTATMKQ